MSLTPLLGGSAAVLGLAAWAWLWPWPADDPVLVLVAVRSPVTAVLLRWGYAACWILTPYFLVLLGATVGGLLMERRGRKTATVPLPPWPHGDDPQIVIGEVHRRTQPGQGERPGWLAIGRRGLYAGAVGYIDYDGTMDTCIAIRTIVMQGKTCHLQAGGGVVADSDPTYEWEETLNKAKALSAAVQRADEGFDD